MQPLSTDRYAALISETDGIDKLCQWSYCRSKRPYKSSVVHQGIVSVKTRIACHKNGEHQEPDIS